MENAPRNIPGIVWEQFSRQPRNDVSFPLRYINPEVAGPQQTATALPGASTATLKEPLITRDYYQTNQEKQTTDWGKKLKDSPEDRLSTFQKTKLGPGFLLNTHKKNISNMLMLTVLVVFLGNFNLVFSSSSSCPSVCECPLEMPKCAPGVSVVLDGCGCCKVCARQLNEDCSLTEPCDHTKGLECNFGASFAATTRGICRAKSEGRPCEYNSRIYQNGESFQPNCKHQCTCIDGAVGCVPLCPQELSLPNLGCANPRLVKVAGQCCEEWVCDDGKETDILEKLFGKDTVTDESERDLTNRNELIDIVKGGLKSLPAFRVQPEGHMFDNQKCIVQTTPWSQCSKTCGTGISTRVTNNNSECKLVRETRICEVRPCTQSPYSSLKKGKKCSRTKKSSQPVKFTYAGCSSLKKYRPKYCGACVDGRCCSPHDTRTIRVKFRCEDGETFNKNVMMIESCKCTYNCPHANEASYPFYRLSNDIHKFRD